MSLWECEIARSKGKSLRSTIPPSLEDYLTDDEWRAVREEIADIVDADAHSKRLVLVIFLVVLSFGVFWNLTAWFDALLLTALLLASAGIIEKRFSKALEEFCQNRKHSELAFKTRKEADSYGLGRYLKNYHLLVFLKEKSEQEVLADNILTIPELVSATELSALEMPSKDRMLV